MFVGLVFKHISEPWWLSGLECHNQILYPMLKVKGWNPHPSIYEI